MAKGGRSANGFRTPWPYTLGSGKWFSRHRGDGVQTFDARVSRGFLNLHEKSPSNPCPDNIGSHITCSQFVFRNNQARQTDKATLAIGWAALYASIVEYERMFSYLAEIFG